MSRLRSSTLSVAIGLVALAVAGTALPFTPGSLVVYRVGDGVTVLTGSAAPVFLEVRTPLGALVSMIPLPIVSGGGNNPLTAAGSSASEGFPTRSVDWRYVVLPGYAAVPGTAAVSGTTSANIPRVIGRVDASGVVDTTTALTDAFSTANPRGAATTDGTNLWISGASSSGTSGGIRYTTLGSATSTQLSTSPTNLRCPLIDGGQLYVSSGSGTTRVAAVGAGIPTSSGQLISNLPGFAVTGSPYQFFLADLDPGTPGLDTLYVADDGGTIQKWCLVGGLWTAKGTIALAGVRGITGIVDSPTNVVLFVTNTSTLQTLTDTSGFNVDIAGALTSIATAAVNTDFRGIALAPVPPPTALSVNRANPNPACAASVDFTVTFDQAVTGVDAADFRLTTTGVAGASVSNVTGAGTTWTVTVGTGTGDGTIRLDVTDDDTIVNGGGTPLGGTGLGNGSFIGGQIYTLDGALPVVTAPPDATSTQTLCQ